MDIKINLEDERNVRSRCFLIGKEMFKFLDIKHDKFSLSILSPHPSRLIYLVSLRDNYVRSRRTRDDDLIIRLNQMDAHNAVGVEAKTQDKISRI